MPAVPLPWHPESFARRRPNLAVRGRVLGALRRFFEDNAFVEVDTPALQVSPGMEPHLQAFATDLQGPHPDDRRRLYLHTSPEFAMKKLLVAGMPRLYQIAHVYRNGERSGTEADRIGVHPHAGDRWEDIVFRIMFDRIEPHLGEGVPCVLTDYPVCMAALSRPKPEDPRLAERFELYACGLELANAFGELTDVAVQRARFEADMDLKQRLYGERFPVDEDFLAALEHGMPECSGIALGFDRLVMLCSGAESIDEVLWLPVAGA